MGSGRALHGCVRAETGTDNMPNCIRHSLKLFYNFVKVEEVGGAEYNRVNWGKTGWLHLLVRYIGGTLGRLLE